MLVAGLACLSLLTIISTSGMRAAELTEADRQIYAPSREIDILHLALDLTPNFAARTLNGSETLRFKPIAQPLGELRLDAVELRISSVSSTEKILAWQATDKELLVTFADEIPAEKEAAVTVQYSATPKKGIYFRTPELGYPAEDTHLFSQGEAIESRYWFPCFDAPNEKTTSEVTCHVPEGMTVLSNGRLMSDQKDPATGLVAVRWLQEQPHSTYLIALTAGYFKKVEDRYRDIPLAFYVPASQIQLAANSFTDTAEMLAFYEKEIGVPYPWPKYFQACVYDFVAGGMENTSLTILTDHTLHPAEFENLRDSHGLVAHELAHQWFGDYVTCKDWANVWLNEGFATYYEELYQGYRLGRDEFLYRLQTSAQGILAHENETNAIVRRDFHSPDDQFSYLAYPKGGWVLHMLRSQLGEDLYRRCVKTFLERHRLDTVTTADFIRVIEELSGRSFDRFFDQWVFHAAQPELQIQYSWDARAKLAKLSVDQTQKTSERVMRFDFPLPVRFLTPGGAIDRVIRIKEKTGDFYFPLPAAPVNVRIDPELTALAKIGFTPPRSMLLIQLTNRADMLGRLLAVQKLSGQCDALSPLKEVLNQDSFHGVRIAASQAIRAIGDDDAFSALLASVQQPDARVRRRVVADLASFYREKTSATLLDLCARETNPDIRASAMVSLGAYARPEIKTRLLEGLRAPSFQNVIGDAAIAAMRAQDDADYLLPLLTLLRETPSAFTTPGWIRALEALAWLSRHETNQTPVREFLLTQLDDKRPRVRSGALRALGVLGDPKAIAAVETLAQSTAEGQELEAARQALHDLRNLRQPSVELGTVRAEVLNLQRDNRDLKKDLETIKKQLDTLGPSPEKKPGANKSVREKPRK